VTFLPVPFGLGAVQRKKRPLFAEIILNKKKK